MYTERKKKRRVNFIPKFHSSLKKFVWYFTMITKRYMYGTKDPNLIGLWSTSLELLKFIGSYPPNLEIKIKLKINIGCAPSCCRCCRADGRRRVYRRREERFADACVVERDRFGGGSVMVWGGIAHGIKSQLIIVAGNMTAVRYRDEILRPVAVPLVQQRNLILQQDNARPHVARVCQDFLANNNIAPLAWPPYSPDLTPIEHMWDELDRRVRKRRNPPATLAQLRNALIDE